MKKHTGSLVLRVLVFASAALALLSLVFVVVYILIRGIPYLKPSLFAWTYTADNVSMTPAIINTVLITLFALLLAVPPGVFSAVYLREYTRRGGRLVKIIRLAAETLSGIPSIIFGLFGMLFFLTRLGWGYSMLSGACTLALMILPLIISTSEEALRAVPDSYREASFALGAGRLRTVMRVVLPAASPGILSGVILAVGRVVGETAAVLYTAGTVAEVASSAFDSTRTLSLHMYLLSSEGFHTGEAYATAVVLLLVVLLINMLSRFVGGKLTKGAGL